MLTEAQKQMVKDAIGDGSSRPKFTNDPMVNAEIDHILDPKDNPSWNRLSPRQRKIYQDEVDEFKSKLYGRETLENF